MSDYDLDRFRFRFDESVWLGYSVPRKSKWSEEYAEAVVGWAIFFSPRDTGRLARSIGKEWDAVATTWHIGPGLSATAAADSAGIPGAQPREYGIYQELGTRYMRPRPYLRPALIMARTGVAPTAGQIPALNVPFNAFNPRGLRKGSSAYHRKGTHYSKVKGRFVSNRT